MAVNIRPFQAVDSAPQDPVMVFREHIKSLADTYCTDEHYSRLLLHGSGFCGLEASKAQLILDYELEQLFVANERQLLKNLHEALQRFTSSDRKLNPKERQDAIQLVCKTKAGYRQGLDLGLAEATVVAFCRANQVKVKMGLFSWAIP